MKRPAGCTTFKVVQSGTNRYTPVQVVHFGTPKIPLAARRGRSKKVVHLGTPGTLWYRYLYS
ncbi:hypothetical protein KHS38_11260 [Mucilaginibacter sp. Bleaf8]|uniref:hypothetical protein n=1 Tax=Mucilaginibacter sp. Bleaf8 TaxID=2834430 RepID=UPI001BD01037|nr:hypothetical protein [Mucilaginibacter sp. Bleaf8]MBS7564982.1 hypothetical protein [Mucilaginibacter sp. Bleaf8]